jgi:hypothetical protein
MVGQYVMAKIAGGGFRVVIGACIHFDSQVIDPLSKIEDNRYGLAVL